MMLVKASDGHGNWHIYEAHDDLTFCGPGKVVEVPIVTEGGDTSDDYVHIGLDLSYETNDDLLPWAQISHVVVGKYLDNLYRNGIREYAVRWVYWRDALGESHRLVTDQSVYICNIEGQTVEALR